MTATIIDGRALADAWLADISVQVKALGVPLHLAALCVGEDHGLRRFVKLKQKAAQSAGIELSSYFFNADDRAGVEQTIRFLSADESVQGIFAELPLPRGWDTDALVALIPPEKDVDALTGKSSVLEPSVLALRRMLDACGIAVADRRVAVVGQGRLIGGPITLLLREQGATVDTIDIGTTEPASISSQADIVVSGVGKPGLVTADWIKEGALVVDFGFKDGKGDVDLESVKQKAGLLTPVPGGMGPLVIAAVLENLVTLATS
jgi:methylenetetrahydrofolate dehydrogenase (NADP+) / methenyltetrahydrofolate cyclohydrolase